MLIDERKQCPARECGAYDGHAPRCPLASVEYKAAEMLRYYEAWLKQHGEILQLRERLKREVTFWQGKHALLRHENNKLRRRNAEIQSERDTALEQLAYYEEKLQGLTL